MGIVQLQILEPADGQILIGSGNVRLHGIAAPSAPPGLFFKWYSSLATAPLGTSLDFNTALSLGSHIVSFTAKDRPGDSVADLEAVIDAGMAGGPEAAEHPCRVHVFVANLVEPLTLGALLSKSSPKLAAEAPVQWSSQDYQNVNRIRYRFRFDPTGLPGGRPSADLVPEVSQLDLDGSGAVPVVRYTGSLPASLGLGNYTLTLRVENTSDPSTGHQVSRSVILTE